MVHLVTKTLDRGPVISYCRFPIRGAAWDALWDQWELDIQPEHGREMREAHPLFKKIRTEGEIRELPLLRLAIRELAGGNIVIKDKTVWKGGLQLKDGADLTTAIERAVEEGE